MKSIVIITITLVLLFVPMSTVYGSWHWSSDVKICGDKICGEENFEYEKQVNTKISDWVKNIFIWYGEDKISEDEVLNAIKFLIDNKIILINEFSMPECSGDAGCIPGIVTKIIDGDTIEVDGVSVRLVLVDTPEYGEYGYAEAGNYIKAICPVGSPVLIDVDDWQVVDKYDRILAVVYCDIWNLNEAILESGWAEVYERYCSESEFGEHSWVKRFGCDTSQQSTAPEIKSQTTPQKEKCDSSYPDFCIPPPPPDLDCDDIDVEDFTVYYPDPHRFDGDGNGIGCESKKQTSSSTSQSSSQQTDCDPSYPDFCIPSPPPDLDCKDISKKRFTVLQPDPHRFDGDKDGIGCES